MKLFLTLGRGLRLFGTLLALVLCVAPASAAGDAFALVARAMQAKESGTYQGRQTIIWSMPAAQGGGMVEIVASAAHRGMRSRLTYLFPPDAAGRVITDDGAQTALYEPQRRRVLIGPSVVKEAQADRQAMLSLMRRNYTCTVMRRERLSGRPCAVVAIRPRRQDGPYKLCWIDQTCPFVLRLEEYDRAGCRRYVSAYDSISFPHALSDGLLSLPPAAHGAQRRVVRQTLAAASPTPSALWSKAGFVGRLPAWLPCGYSLLRLSLLAPAPNGPPLVEMRCSDGLQTLTITEVKAAASAPPLATLNAALAHYGQQAWLADCRGVRIMVRGDLSLPPEVGAEMAHALASGTEQNLARAFGHQFGLGVSKEMEARRRTGWSYCEMVSAALFLRQHPAANKAFHALLGKQQSWPAMARRLHADADELDAQARTWIAASWQ